MNQIKLVVYNNHTLGYILPELPDKVQVLSQSIWKGAIFNLYPDSLQINRNDIVRVATKNDFDSFRVSLKGYENNKKYQYYE